MRKILLIMCLGMFGFTGYSQTNTEAPHFFAQCMLNIPDNADMSQLEAQLRENPYVQVARLDLVSRRAFIVTKDIETFNEESFLSWLGDRASAASCIQIGLHGVDAVNPYPFTNCND